MRALFKIGLTPPMHTLIETTGRRSGLIRQVPVSYGHSDGCVWVIAQHSVRAGWVRNLQADPKVRLLLDGHWHSGTARLVPEDDVKARLATRRSTNPLLRRVASSTFTALETKPCSIRIELAP